jgi:YfiR/HmsC-like
LPEHPIRNAIAEVREVRSPRDLGDPQMLYVGAAHTDFLRTVASDAGRHVLVVTNEAQGLDVGSALNFVTVDKRVRFEVSLTAADRAGIKISSELLSVALRVHGGRRQSGHPCIRLGLPQDEDSPCSIREARRGFRMSIY